MLKINVGNHEGVIAEVADKDGVPSLAVATQPLKEYTNRLTFFTNATYGRDMNKDGSFGGNPEEIHDGIDNVYWTASALSGTWTFNSVAQNHTGGGAQSVDATATVGGDQALFTRGAGTIDLDSYAALTGWIYITGWGTTGTRHVTAQARNGGVLLGNAVNVDDYVDTADLNTWQQFVVPKADMNLSGQDTDELVVTTVNSGGVAPNYYLDDMQWEETGATLVYTVVPNDGTWLYIDKLQMFVADAYTGIITVAGNTENATFPSIPYNSFLGQAALSAGILYQRHTGGSIANAFTIRQHSDLMNLSDARITGMGGDGTNSWYSVGVQWTKPVILKSERDDYLSLSVSDDLTGLLELYFSAGGYEETR